MPDNPERPSRDDEHHDAVEVVRFSPEDQISLLEILWVLLKHRYTILASTIGVAALASLHLLLTFSPTYTAEASFIPQQGGQGGVSDLQAVAGRFGVEIPSSGSGSRSLRFYEDILTSREILRPILQDTFSIVRQHGEYGARASRGTILQLLEVEVEDQALREEQGVRWLRGAMDATSMPSTGVVRFSVTTPWPQLSDGLASRLLERVNEFNLDTRQSQAAAERRFIEDRLEEVGNELEATEARLRQFLESNRQFQNSPELVFEHQRLQRQMNMRQQLYTSLAEAYEQARISEVRNTPVITVLEPPKEPVERDPRGLKRRALLGLALGAVLGVISALVRTYLGPEQEKDGEAYRMLSEVWGDTVDDIRRITRSARWRLAGSRDDGNEPS